MLKKIAYAAITSGLLLASLGATAMVNDSPFPACDGKDCATMTHDEAVKNTVASASVSKWQVAERTSADSSPFPFDNSKD